MNKFRFVSFSRAKTFLSTLVVGLAVTASASADLNVCAHRWGSMRFWDAATNRCGYVSGDNEYWGYLPGGWNDRADQFGNDGNTHTVCIYSDAYGGGQAVTLRRGYAVTWRNVVSSNYWSNLGC